MGIVQDKLNVIKKDSCQHWLMKSEPTVYSIDHLQKDKIAIWEGVRNPLASRFMREEMKVHDRFLFYHSNAKPPGVAGTGIIYKVGVIDPEQFIPESQYYDPRSTRSNIRWYCVEVKFDTKFEKLVSLNTLKNEPNLHNMLVIQRGMRLSIQPVTEKEYNTVLALAC